MTNDPPTGDGEELVEDDLPGWSESTPEPPAQPLGSAATRSSEGDRADEAFREIVRQVDELRRDPAAPDESAPPLSEILGNEVEWRQHLSEHVDAQIQAFKETFGEAAWNDRASVNRSSADLSPVDDDPDDAVYDQLDVDLVGSVVGAQHDDYPRAAPRVTQLDHSTIDSPLVPGGASLAHVLGSLPDLDTAEPVPRTDGPVPAVPARTIGGLRLVGGPMLGLAAVVAVGVIAVAAFAATSLGGSDEPADAVASSDGGVASTPASAGAVAPVTSDPADGYTFCQVHPDESAQFCRPHYSSVDTKSTLFPASPRRVFEHTVTFGAPIPTNPELPLEYKLVISGAAGPTIEQILSGGPGQPLSCVRLVNGAPTADGPEDVCGQVTAPDTIYMQADLSAYGEGPIKTEWFAQEIEAGDILRGDYKDLLGGSGVLMR